MPGSSQRSGFPARNASPTAEAASAAQTSQVAPEAKAISARIATPETFRTARPAPSPRKLYKKP